MTLMLSIGGEEDNTSCSEKDATLFSTITLAFLAHFSFLSTGNRNGHSTTPCNLLTLQLNGFIIVTRKFENEIRKVPRSGAQPTLGRLTTLPSGRYCTLHTYI